MDQDTKQVTVSLPHNARRVLEPGEQYIPLGPGEGVPEVTTRSVGLGLLFCAIFAMAAAYVALKLGQGIEAAIPIAILAIGISHTMSRKSTLLENVITQSVGANSSHVVSGAVFTIPALYMLAREGMIAQEPSIWQVIVVSFLGGCLGILFLIPLRHHFMVEMQGRFPWPEGTAPTEIILSGERAGGQAKILAISAGIGALYDGAVQTLHAMAEQITFKSIWIGGFLEQHFMKLAILNNAAIVGTNPVSGMTMLTLIVTGFVMLKMGLTGAQGMFVTMMVGGVVCTALAASGALASDLKVGYWIGATPAKQLGLKFLGTLVAAIFCGIAMWLLAQSGEGFGSASIPAPQASAMKEILIGIFGTVSQPLQWYTFGLGVIFAVILRIVGVPALAFALGMYLPMQLNTPVLLGGILSWFVKRTGKCSNEAVAKRRHERGILIASGLIAGGALMGVFVAFLGVVAFGGDLERKASLYLLSDHAFEGVVGEGLALVGLFALCLLVVRWARAAAK